jgi:hypothetical protein
VVRRDSYVYFHRDANGSIFYVGKGTGRRAWDQQRHPVWVKYVTERLHGVYSVEIRRDGLTEDDAEWLEEELIERYGKQLVNWFNPGRDFDYAGLERFHKLRDANRAFVAETRPLEQTAPETAIERYRQALVAMFEYESIEHEHGLMAELIGPRDCGEPVVLDRLTLCLIRIGRAAEAVSEADRYFVRFPGALTMVMGQRIKARVNKHRTSEAES